MDYETIIRCLDEKNAPSSCRAVIKEAVDRYFNEYFSSSFVSRTQFLDHHGVRHIYQDLCDRSAEDVARMLRKLAMPMAFFLKSIALRVMPEPWDRWRDKQKLVVVLGGRQATIVSSSHPIPRLAVDEHDFHAHEVLQRFVFDLAIDCSIETRLVPMDVDPKTVFQELWKRPDVGAIVVLGSLIANPLAPMAAREILQGGDPPGKFRFRNAVPGMKADPLSENQPARERQKVGIVFMGVLHERTPDYEIAERLKPAHVKRVRFKDAGWLLLNQRDLKKPLILIAGHGPVGTMAATYALTRTDDVARFLELSRQAGNAISQHSRPDTVAQVVTVENGQARYEGGYLKFDWDPQRENLWVRKPNDVAS